MEVQTTCSIVGILKHNHAKTFPLAGKTMGARIYNHCDWQVFTYDVSIRHCSDPRHEITIIIAKTFN